MAAKLAFVFVAALVVFQMITWGVASPRVVRDAAEKNVSQTIEDTLQSIHAEIQNLVAKFQDNELIQNLTAQMQTFGNAVQAEGKRVVEKLQGSDAKN